MKSTGLIQLVGIRPVKSTTCIKSVALLAVHDNMAGFLREDYIFHCRPSPTVSKVHAEDVKRAILNKFHRLKEASPKPKMADIFRKMHRADSDKSN